MSGPRVARYVAAVIVAVAVVRFAPPSARAQVLIPITWSGTGSWDDPLRWSLGTIPGTGHLAQISSGTATVTGNHTVAALALSGGTLDGNSGTTLSLTAAGSTWTGGVLNGAGTLAIQSGATFEISGTGSRDFDGRTIENFGTVSWSGATLRSGHAGAIVNRNAWNDAATAAINNAYLGTTATFTNMSGATYSKSAGTTTFDLPFTNAGTVSVTGGTLSLTEGGTFSSGSATTTSGGGTLALTAGTFTLDGALGATNFTLAGGNIAGTHTFGAGTVTWNNGTFNTTGTTSISPASTLVIATGADHDYDGRAFVNSGIVNWNAGNIRSGHGGSIMNNAAWNDQTTSAAQFNNAYLGTSTTFTNSVSGTYTKTGASTTTIDIPLLQSGTINVQAGTLSLTEGGTFFGGSTVTVAGGAAFNLAGGTFTLDGTVGVSALTFTGGQVTGNGTLGGGTFTWNGGTFNNATTTTIGPEATFVVATTADHDFNTHAFVNNGTVNWNAGRLRSGNGGSILNNATWNDAADSALNNDYLGTVAIFTNNSGATYAKSGSGTSTVEMVFNNNGTVNVGAGVLDLGRGGTTVSGATFNVTNGATLKFSDDYAVNNAASLAGTGAHQLAAGTLTLGGTLTAPAFSITGGTLAGTHTFGSGASVTWTAGNWNAAGTTTIAPGGTLTISSTADHDYDLRVIVNQGTVNWNGGRLRGGHASSITNQAQWNDAAGSSFNNDYQGTLTTFTNAVGATYTKTGSGTSTVGIPFHHAGAIDVQAGTLSLTGGGTFSAGAVTTVNKDAALNLAAGTFTLSGTLGANAFTVTNGTIAGTHTFGAGTVTWNDGTFNSSGTTTIGAGTTFVIATANDHDFDARAFVNNGTVQWTGGRLRSGHGGSILNQGSWNDSSGSAMNNDYQGTLTTFTNAAGATYTKSGNGTTVIDVGFNHHGTLAVTGGTLDLSRGGTIAAGSTVSTDAGATLKFSADYTIADAAALGGLGTYLLSGGTLTLGGTFGASLITHAGGVLAGTYTLGNGTLTWNAGSWNSAGTTTIGPASTLVVASTNLHDFNARTIDNRGTVNWTGGQLRSGNSGSFLNAVGGIVNDTASSSFNNAYGGVSSTVANAGHWNKNSAGTSTIDVPFTNTGTVTVNAGTLSYSDGGSSAAGSSLVVGSGASLAFSGGTFTLADGALITGTAGTYALAGGTLVLGSGTLAIPNLTFSGGTLAGPGVLATPALNQTGGALTANFTLSGHSTWTGGSWNTTSASAATVASGGTLVLTSAAVHDFNERAITNHGTVNWQGGQLRSGQGGSFTNVGTLNDTASSSFNVAYGGAFSFSNSGTYNKSSPGITDLAVPFTNTGTVNVNAGTLDLSNGGSNAAGAVFNLASGAGLTVSGGTFTFASTAGLVGPAGTYQISAGTLVFTAGALTLPNLTLSGGTLTIPSTLTVPALSFTGGTLNGAGSVAPTVLTQSGGAFATPFTVTGNSTWSGGNWNSTAATTATISGGAVLTISSTNVHDFNFRTIANSGTIQWQGGQLRSGQGGAITNALGAAFNDEASNSINAAYGGAFTFTNAGTYNKNAAGTTTLSLPFTNSGTVNLNAGTLAFDGGGSSATGSRIAAATGTNLAFTGGTFTLGEGAVVSGSGANYALTSGTLTIESGTLSLPNLTLSGGTLSGPGSANVSALTLAGGIISAPLNVTGISTWTAGNLNAATTTTVVSGGSLIISGAGVHDFNQHSIINDGIVSWQGGPLRTGQGGSFTNNSGATFSDSTTSTFNAAYGGAASFNNQGTYLKSAGATEIQVPFTNNQGGILVTGGTLRFTSNFTHNGGLLAVSGGGRLEFDQGLNLGTGTLTGSGTIKGNVTAAGLISPGSSPGNLTIEGNLTLASTSTFLVELGGTSQGTNYDFLSVTGNAALAGTLQLKFANGFQDSALPSNSFTVLTANGASGLTGAFANVPTSGLRIFTTDGFGSFQVNFGAGSAFAANSVVLSNFVAVPEPSTWVLFGTGAAVLLWRVRRRRRAKSSRPPHRPTGLVR